MKIAIIQDIHICEKGMRCRCDDYLEAVLNKLDYIGSNNDKVIVAGDLFHIYNNSNYLFNRVYTLFNKYKGKFIVIPGNHDIFHNNINSLERTSLGSLYYTGAIDVKTSGFEIDGTEFEVSLVMKDMDSIPVDTENKKILIGHNYFDTDLAPDESLSREDIKKLNYRIVFLGHDHKPYEEEFVGNSILVRMGSLTRIDVQEYNKDREICYYQYDTKTGDYSRIVIPHKKTKEIYIEEAFNRVNKKTTAFNFMDISRILEKFKKQSEGAISLHSVLKRLNTPEKSIGYIKQVHDYNNITYN